MFPSGAGGDPADSSSLDGSLTSLPPIPPAASKGKQKLGEKERLDAAIIGTNNSSIVSKRSVERLYSRANEHQFLRYFVKKPQRRSPVINRGYWLRMQAIEYVVHSFLRDELPHLPATKRGVVVNLGCGYDPLPFQCLSRHVTNAPVLYVDIDYPELVAAKASVIARTPELHGLLTNPQHHPEPDDHVHYRSDQYLALGCDLRHLETLQRLFETHRLVDGAILLTAEVSLTYMPCESVDALIQWASLLPDARFSVLEQILPAGPHHPFARTMLKHFDSLSTPLKSVSTYPRLSDQVDRFSSRGWTAVDACDLLAFWSNRISRAERDRVDAIPGEPFDEFEEFFLFCQHYFILRAHSLGHLHTPFRGPGVSWSVGGEYCRFPARSLWPPNASSNNNNNNNNSRSSSTLSAGPDAQPRPPPKTGFAAEFAASAALQRRFGAAAAIGPDSLVYHGGQGQTARLGTTLCVTHSSEGVGLAKGTSPGPRVCHTMTTLPSGKVLLVGGRTSPDRPLGDSWLLEGGVWRELGNLPSPRYRHSATLVPDDRVLVYGGRGENRATLDDCLLWSEGRGWRNVPMVGASLPPARFSAGLCWTNRGFGAIGGGLDAKGDVLDDMWRLELREDRATGNETLQPFWSVVNVLSSRNLWKRFGGQMIYAGYGCVLYVGGVSGQGLMKSESEILEVDCNKITVRAVSAGLPRDKGPFLIGHSVVCLQDRVVICGGGGVCFSMGSCTNDGMWTLSASEKYDSWRFIEEGCGLDNAPGDGDTPTPDTPAPDSTPMPCPPPAADHRTEGPVPDVLDVKRVTVGSADEFARIVEAGEPVVLQGLDIGACVKSWTPEHLKACVGADRLVVVHATQAPVMSFQHKNFKYQTMRFGEFIDTAFPPPLPASPSHAYARLYFRSLSASRPSAAPVSLYDDFPQLAREFTLPPALAAVREHMHSSPLRISSADVGMWLHYDGMANVLCHIGGTKLLRLYPPADVTRLAFPPGATTSTIVDVFGAAVPGTTPHGVVLRPGDVLYIPPLWLHAARPLTPCVAVNVFFRNLGDAAYAHGRDVYASRDLAAYEKGRRKVGGIVRDFSDLPHDVRRFYLLRLAEELKAGANE